MGIFSDVTKLGAATGRQKVASFQKQANDMMYADPSMMGPSPEELSWAEQHPMLAGAGRAVATGVGGGLAGWGTGALMNRFAPGFVGNHPNWTGAINSAGAGLGAAGANYLAGGDGMSAGIAGLGAAGGLAGGSYLGGKYPAGADAGRVRRGVQHGLDNRYLASGAGGAAASAATDAVRGKKKKKDDDEKNSNDMYMSPEEELSWAEQHPTLAGIGRAAATGVGGGLAGWGTGALMGRFAPGFSGNHPNWTTAINSAGAGLGAAGANYLTGGDAMSAGLAGLGAAGGLAGAQYGASKMDPAADPGRMRRALDHGLRNRYLGAGAGGALASGAYDALSGEKVSNEEPMQAEGPSMLSRVGRTLATGAGGALGAYGSAALLGRFAPNFVVNSPRTSAGLNLAGAGLGAAGANYLAGGDAPSAAAAGLGAAAGQLGGGYAVGRHALSDGMKLDNLARHAKVLGYGGYAGAGGMLADAGMQAAGY